MASTGLRQKLLGARLSTCSFLLKEDAMHYSSRKGHDVESRCPRCSSEAFEPDHYGRPTCADCRAVFTGFEKEDNIVEEGEELEPKHLFDSATDANSDDDFVADA
jgi:hypothetical protein